MSTIEVSWTGQYSGSATIPILSSCCTKSPIRWRDQWIPLPVAVGLFSLTLTLSMIGLGIQVTIFKKLKEVQSQGKLISLINTTPPSNLRIELLPRLEPTTHPVRLQSQPFQRRILSNRRNLISPTGSCVSFTVMQMWYLLLTYYLFHVSPSGPPMAFYLLLFFSPSMDFFLLNLFETLLSPTLRDSLFDLTSFI